MKSKKNFQEKVMKCSNPKCITNHENYVKPRFKQATGKQEIYLCEFCSAENKIH